MSDEELVKRLRAVDHLDIEDCFMQSPLYAYAADRIEQLVASNEYLNSRLENVLSREAETYAEHKEQLEQLVAINEAARADAKEAEAYAEELEMVRQYASALEDELRARAERLDKLLLLANSMDVDFKAYAKAHPAALRITGPNSDGEYWLHINVGGRSGGINLGVKRGQIVKRLLDAASETGAKE